MLEGSCTVLEKICDNSDRIKIKYSVFHFPDAYKLVYNNERNDHASYFMEKAGFRDIEVKFCDNLKRVFGYFPLIIHFNRID